MKCKYCGAEIASDAIYCPSCSGVLSEASEASAAESYSKECSETEYIYKTSKGLGIASMCCAIAGPLVVGGLALCCMPGALVGEIAIIVALVLGIVSNKKAEKYGQKKNGFAKAGIIISSVILLLQLSATLIFGLFMLILYLPELLSEWL